MNFFSLTFSYTNADGPQDRASATHETELGDHVFCLSRSHTDTDPTSRERAAAAEIEPGTSSPRALPTELPRPPQNLHNNIVLFVLIFYLSLILSLSTAGLSILVKKMCSASITSAKPGTKKYGKVYHLNRLRYFYERW